MTPVGEQGPHDRRAETGVGGPARAPLLAAGASLAALALAGCGGDDGQQAMRCDDISLSTDSAQPLDSLEVRGLTGAAIDEVTASLSGLDDNATARLPLLRLEDERAVLLVPPHPSGALAGGAVEVRFSRGEHRCDPRPLRIAALPPAPGEADRVLTRLDELLTVQLDLVGTTRAALRSANADTLLPPLVPLFIAQAVLDRMAEHDARDAPLFDEPVDSGTGQDYHALFDALLARAGVRQGLAATIRHMRSAGGTGEVALRGDRPRNRRGGFVRFASHAPVQASRQFRQVTECPLPGVAGAFLKPDAATLSCWMGLALHADLATSGRPAETYDRFLTVVGLGATIPHPGIKTAFTSVSARALLYKMELEAIANLYPRYFVEESLELDLHPATFREDDPGPGYWDNVRITARSKGWTLDRTILSTMLSASGLDPMGGIGGAGKRIAWDVVDPKAGEWMADVFDGLITDALIDKGAIGLVTEGGGAIRVDARRFGPVDITEPEWSEVRITGPAVQHDLDAGRQWYRPREVETSLLRVWTAQQKFGDQFQDAERTLGVAPIRVQILPPRRTVKTGALVPFMVVVDNAVDPSLAFRATAGQVIEPARYGEADGQHVGHLRFRAPESEDLFPVRLKAISTADRSHLRVVKERSATARIDLWELRIEPVGTCLGPKDTETFTAYLGNRPTDAVSWSASAGDIEPDGMYTAPRRAGEVTISAVLRDDPDLAAEATVAVRRCDWTLTIRGGPSAGFYWGRKALLIPDRNPALDMFGSVGMLTQDMAEYMQKPNAIFGGEASAERQAEEPEEEQGEAASEGGEGGLILLESGDSDAPFACRTTATCVQIFFGDIPEGETGSFPAGTRIELGESAPGGTFRAGPKGDPGTAVVNEDGEVTQLAPELYLMARPAMYTQLGQAWDPSGDVDEAAPPLVITSYEDGRMTARIEGIFHTLVDPSAPALWNSWEDVEVRIRFSAKSP